MPTIHTVAQGETLTGIAKKYKYSSWQKIYNHAANAEFKALRDNPNIIFPGDKIVIPDIEPRYIGVATTKQHVFCLKRPKEVFRMKLQGGGGQPLAGKRVVLKVGGQVIDGVLADDGLLEVELPDDYASTGAVDVYMEDGSATPSHSYELQLGHLDPVDKLSGVQARCNALGFDCGIADGVMGAKTRAGVKSFQAAQGLDIDGVPGPLTKAKLKQVYGC